MGFLDKIFNFEFRNNTGMVDLACEFFALYVKKIFDSTNHSFLIVTPSLYEANSLFNCFNENEALLFEVDDILTFNAVASSPEMLANRLAVLNELIIDNKRIVITDLNGYLKFLPNKDDYLSSMLDLKVNMQISPSDLAKKLIDLGYVRESIVSKTGEIGVRGFILDLYAVDFEYPIRIEFFGDTIESIRFFDVETQRSISNVDSVTIKPFSDKITNNISSIYEYLFDPIVVYKDYGQLKVVYERMVNDVYSYFKNSIKCPAIHV